ncbi:hypothetical protein GYA44_02360 [Candidatus Microgenomates bacterium]|jgi:hypothetical protein|nr:hypothetical protein [Candidatus Microgenomates bacterium]
MESLFAIPFLLFFFYISLAIVLAILSFGFSVWMLVDCIQRDEEEFKDKKMWLILLVLGLLFQYSLLVSLVYFFVVKKTFKN